MCLSARNGGRRFVLPATSAAEAALVENFCILPARSLAGARVLINRLGGLRIAVTQLLGGSEQ